jgi:hypothetical protein
MSTPTKDQAQTDAQAANDAIVAAANQLFIDNTDAAIQVAISQGVFFVDSLAFDKNVDPRAIFDHYANLGYGVSFPDFVQNQQLQPAELFGDFWINFWQNNLVPQVRNKYPIRFLISWKP